MALKDGKGFLDKLLPVLLVFSLGLAFVVGVLWQKVNNLEKGDSATATQDGQAIASPQAATVDIETIKDLWKKDVIKFGDANKKVLFVEIADPSCPFCHVAAGLNPELAAQIDTQTNRFKYVSDGGKYVPPGTEMKKLIDSGQASYVYIYFNGHNNGEMAMKALYCANEKGKFWEAHDLLMSQPGYDLQNTTVKNDKAQSGKVADFLKSAVDTEFMKTCLDSGKYDARLASDQALANSLSVQGTPGFFVNATRFSGAYSYSDMKSVVDAALK